MKLILFYKILEMSLQASFVVIAVLLVRMLLKNKPKLFSYVLWLAVFFRLLCPISIELPISFVPEKVSSGAVMKEVADTYAGKYQIHWNYSEEFDKALKHGVEPIIQKDEMGEIESAYIVTAEDGISEPDTVYNAWLPTQSDLWILGMTVLVLYSIISYLKIKKKLIGAVPYDEEADIYMSDYIQTAFVIDVFYPKIYLPSSLSDKELGYILLHEKHHIQRKDYFLKMLAFLALCIHWFNPLVWIAFMLFTKDMEMSCDEAVLRRLGDEIREEYSASLLSLATGKRNISAAPLAFGEGNTKARIENALKWKKPAAKTVAFTAVLCILVGTVSFANVENDMMTHPYEWTSTVKLEDIDYCAVTSWKDDTLEYLVTKSQLRDFVYVLNELSKEDITKEMTSAKKEITVLLTCGEKEIMLTYGNGITMISFDDDTSLGLEKKVWQTDDEKMARCMKNMIAQGIRVRSDGAGITTGSLPPIREEVLNMRAKVLEGMSENKIARLTELVQVENQDREWKYLKGSGYAELNDPESAYWKLYTQSGEVQIGWGVSCEAPGFDPEGDMTEEEYYETYGTPFVYTIDIPWAEVFYGFIDELRSLVKTDLLDADFDALEEYMRLAVEKHDVNYLHQIYYILHDLDYYLLRYGPEDVGKITVDDSTARKYYGVLSIYEDELPSIVSVNQKVSSEKYDAYWHLGDECVVKTYYQMRDESFRAEVTVGGEITEVFSYEYRLELEGENPISGEKTKCVLLSNTKSVAFDDIIWKEMNLKTADTILVSVQLCENK